MASNVCISGEHGLIVKNDSYNIIIMHYTFGKVTHCFQYHDGLRYLLMMQFFLHYVIKMFQYYFFKYWL